MLNTIYKKEIALLKKHGWLVSESFIQHTKTGCVLSNIEFFEDFIVDKYNELVEDEKEESLESNEELLKRNGFDIICESPLEIINSNGDISTGECAHFIIHKLRY